MFFLQYKVPRYFKFWDGGSQLPFQYAEPPVWHHCVYMSIAVDSRQSQKHQSDALERSVQLQPWGSAYL